MEEAMNLCNNISGTLLSVLTLGIYKPHSVFHGDPFIKVTPRNIGVVYENFDCFFPSDAGIHVINGWYIPPVSPQADTTLHKTILVCSDIRGNMSHNLDLLKFLTMTFPERAIVIFDYVGFGLSSCDTASFEMCLKSAVRALEYTLERTSADKLIIWGYRHGATVASYLVTRLINPIERLVLDTPLMRYSDDIRDHLGSHVHDPVSLIRGTLRTTDNLMDLEHYLEGFISHTDSEYLQEQTQNLTVVKCLALVPASHTKQQASLVKYSHFVYLVPLTSTERTSLFMDQHRILENIVVNDQRLITF